MQMVVFRQSWFPDLGDSSLPITLSAGRFILSFRFVMPLRFLYSINNAQTAKNSNLQIAKIANQNCELLFGVTSRPGRNKINSPDINFSWFTIPLLKPTHKAVKVKPFGFATQKSPHLRVVFLFAKPWHSPPLNSHRGILFPFFLSLFRKKTIVVLVVYFTKSLFYVFLSY